MYEPVHPRPKKTSIIRSRNGCKPCRERRTKCDEQRPSCGTCIRLGKLCEPVRQDLRFRVVTGPSPQNISSGAVQTGAFVANEQCPQTSQRGDHLSSLDIVNSLQHTERDVFYTTYWEDACLPAVHPVFSSMTLLAWDYPMLKDAILALSSCNLSRIRPDRRGSSSPSLTVPLLSPNLVHQTRSQLYYSSAIKKFVALGRTEIHSHTMAEIVAAVLVMFAYIESSMGNFHGFQCHVQGLADFLREIPLAIGDVALQAHLIASMQVRFVVWWARAYFSTIDVHRGLPSVPLPRLLAGCFESVQARRVIVMSIMWESHRLNSREMLGYWYRAESGSQRASETSESTYLRLNEETKKLDEWLAHLPPYEQPQTFLMDESELAEGGCDIDSYINSPIQFVSQDAALTFAYYVVARIMQCTGLLRQLRNPCDQYHHESSCYEESSWVSILLRIAKGIDLKSSIARNTYTIGFSGLMLPAILRCQDLSLGIEIQDWLESLQRLQPTEEGAFPVYQTRGIVKAINQQRMMGREIFGVTLPTDDAGGTPKFASYNSQSISTMLLHGKDLHSANLSTQCVSIDM